MNESMPDAPAAAAAPPRARRPLWARALALVPAPRSVFEELADRPAWFWTSIVLAAAALVIILVIYEPVVYPSILERAEEQGLTSEQMARAESMYASAGFKVFTAVSAAAANVVTVIITGLLLFAACTFLLGGRATVRQALSVAAHAMLVLVPRALLLLPVMLARRDPAVTLGPGVLFPASEAEGYGARVLATFLGGLDLFNLWALALCILGMAVVSRLPTRQVATALAVGYLCIIMLWSLAGAAFQR